MRTAQEQAARHLPSFTNHVNHVIRAMENAKRYAAKMADCQNDDERARLNDLICQCLDSAKNFHTWASEQHYYMTTRK